MHGNIRERFLEAFRPALDEKGIKQGIVLLQVGLECLVANTIGLSCCK